PHDLHVVWRLQSQAARAATRLGAVRRQGAGQDQAVLAIQQPRVPALPRRRPLVRRSGHAQERAGTDAVDSAEPDVLLDLWLPRHRAHRRQARESADVGGAQMNTEMMQTRLRISSMLVAAGLVVEATSLGWKHPTAFLWFVIVGGGLMAA